MPRTLEERFNKKGCCVNFTVWLLRRVHKNSWGLFKHVKDRGNGTVIWVANDDCDFDELHD